MLEIARRRMSGAAMRRAYFAAGLLTACLAVGASGEPLAPERVPEPLRPWIDWALLGHESERCPFLQGSPGSAECVWPARLELALGARQGSFVQRWRVHADAWVPLPGDAKHWPQAVQVDGRPAPVVESGGRPSVRLARGIHDVRGELVWDALPELLQIPAETGLLAVSQNGEPVAFPKRDAQGRLWLHTAADEGDGAESRLEITVHRRVTDEIPLRVTTLVRLEVSGPAREVVLGPALPEGAIPISLSAPLPARLDPDGKLRVQVRPGSWFIALEARMPGPVEGLALPAPDGPWDDREEWVFDARPSLRLVTIEGAVSVDPQQTELPEGWRGLPAYAMEPGSALRFVTKRRGDADPAPDRLSLARTFWLDFDGGGYTVTDRIGGEVVRSDRLGMAAGTELGRVAVNGQDQFITQIPGEEGPGVEIPRGGIEITADSRIARDGAPISAVGWNQDFQSVSAELQLPPGWRLLHASGVDGVSWTWVTRWSLLDLFVVLVVSMAFLRLFGPAWGALALLGLALTYTEPGAPRWVWVAVLSGEALRRALVRGRLAVLVNGLWRFALLALVLLAVPFAFFQIRSGFFPALEDPGIERLRRAPMARSDAAQDMGLAEGAGTAEVPMPASEPLRALGYLAKERDAVKESRAGSSFYQSWAPDPKARITTGPGLPSWSWRSVGLRWRGPVERGQTLRLVLAPPWLNLGLALLRVALLGALIGRVLIPLLPGGGFPLRRAAGALTALAALLLAAPPPAAAADLPSPELLNELRTRLLEKPACHPQCAASPRLRLEAEPSALALRIEIDTAAPTAVPLPGSARDWVPEQVIVDGAPATALRRDGAGVLWLQLDAGAHQVLVAGALPDRDTIELPLPLKPHRVEASSRGWSVQGIGEDGAPEDNLQLTRLRDATDGERPALEPSALPAFASITRTLRLGLTWQVETLVTRLSPADSTLVLEVPLLAGESVTSAGVRAENGLVFVSLGPGAMQMRWTSALDVTPSFELRAPDVLGWTETWILDASPVWHVAAEGIPVIHQDASGVRLREWRPWPGERVVVQVTRPEGVEGPTLTLDGSQLAVSPGLRATQVSLELRLRSSLGGQHAIQLPEGAVLERVTIDGAEQPIRQEGREVMLPLTPGTRTLGVAWQEPRGITTRFKSSEVDLRLPSVNSDVTISLPVDRWLLWVSGPRLGPSVLFWPLLAVLAAVAAGLGQVRNTPLRSWHWLLLGLGLTQVPLWAGALVACWLLALAWRGERGMAVRGRWFDLVQLTLVLWTLAALAVLLYSIQQGLLGLPEMQVAGNRSSAHELRWYQDRANATLPQPWLLSIPLLAYRAVMLAWALWLATALLRWLRWGWAQFSSGELWRGRRRITAA
jgi:hypothetical protein